MVAKDPGIFHSCNIFFKIEIVIIYMFILCIGLHTVVIDVKILFNSLLSNKSNSHVNLAIWQHERMTQVT